jgi:hypothetical protein
MTPMPKDVAMPMVIDSNECHLTAITGVLPQKATVNAFNNQSVAYLSTEVISPYCADHRHRDAQPGQGDQGRSDRPTTLHQQCRQFGFLVQFRILADLSQDIQGTLAQADDIYLILTGHGLPE